MDNGKRCPRCGIGIDNDGDGDCANCANKSSKQLVEELIERKIQEEIAKEHNKRHFETLRDQFAIAAIQGHCASDPSVMWQTQDHTEASRRAYLLADAMLKAREQ